MSSTKVVCNSGWIMAMLVLAFAANGAMSAITCSQAVSKLLPCLDYLKGGANSVTVPCCSGVDSLNKMARSSADRRSLCVCFKQAAAALGVKYDRAEALPKNCHVDVGIPIRPDVDCTKLGFMEGGIMQEQKSMLHN